MTHEMTIAGRKVRLFDSMYDYVEDADFGYYETHDGNLRKAPFLEAVKPQDDSNFMIFADDTLEYEGLEYTRVNFGEDDDPDEYGNSFLLTSALDEEVYLVYVKMPIAGQLPTYKANAGCFRTEELAHLSGETETEY